MKDGTITIRTNEYKKEQLKMLCEYFDGISQARMIENFIGYACCQLKEYEAMKNNISEKHDFEAGRFIEIQCFIDWLRD